MRNARQEHDCQGAPSLCSSAFQTAYAACFEGIDRHEVRDEMPDERVEVLQLGADHPLEVLEDLPDEPHGRHQGLPQIPKGDNIWAGGDQGCLITKDITFGNCKFQCSKPQQKMVCETNFTFCIADCPNL